MHPTIDEQLAGACRLLDQARLETGLPAGALELIDNARRLVSQVARSAPKLPDFHRSDNAKLLELLEMLRDHLEPRDVALLDRWGDSADDRSVEELNLELRGVLSRTICEVDAEAQGALALISQYLRHRVESAPS